MKIDPEYWLSKASKCELKYCEKWDVNINDIYRYLAEYLITGEPPIRHIEGQLFIVHVKCRHGRDGHFRCMAITLQCKGIRPRIICCYDGPVNCEFKEGEVTWKHNRMELDGNSKN